MTTGENKKQFEEWLINYLPSGDLNIVDWFYNLPFEMQIGVYLAYYDSLGYDVEVQILYDIDDNPEWSFNVWKANEVCNSLMFKDNFKTRNEAYKEAFKEADILTNKTIQR